MDINQLSAKIEEVNGRGLTDEERYEIEVWQRGRTFAQIPPHAREEIQAMLEGYVRTDADLLIAEDPANRDAVLAKHAQAHASTRLLVRFLDDFNNALNASKTPDVVKNGFRQSQVPPESV